MSKCPACGKKLHFYNFSQFCPHCGVNMKFCNFEENFIKEAKLAELTQAKYSVKIRNLRYSFTGSKLIYCKLAVMLLPILSMLIPGGKFTVNYPFRSFSSDFGLIGFIGAFMNGTIKFSHDMSSSAPLGEVFSSMMRVYSCYIIVFLCAFLCLLFSLLGFLSIKNMQKITACTAGVGMAACTANLILEVIFIKKSESLDLIDTSFAWNFIIVFIMFTAVFIVNILLSKKGIHPVYDEGTMERYILLKKVKAGEVKMEDLPLPVVETAETRKIDEEIARQEQAFNDRYGEKVKEAEGQ